MRFFFAVLISAVSLHHAVGQVGRIERAVSAYEQGDYEKALSRVTKATQHPKTKDKPQAWQVQGKVYVALAQQASSDSSHDAYLQQAIDSYQHAVSVDSSQSEFSSQPLDSLWNSYFIQGRDSAQQQNFTEAFTAFQRANRVRPNDTSTYLALADLALQQQDLSSAQQNYNYLLDSLDYEGNRLYEVYNTLIDLSSLQNSDLESTQKLVEEAQEYFPDSTHWIEREFALLITNEAWDQAEQLIENAGLADSRQIDFLRELAHQHRISNHDNDSFKYYEKALALAPKNLDVLYDLAYLHQEEAIALEKEIGRNERTDKEKQKQALYHYRESLRYLNEAISQDQQNDHTRQNITLVETHINSLEKL